MPSSLPVPGSRREVLLLAWPIGVSMISYTLKGVVDALMVGRLGVEALAGMGLATVLSFTVLAFAMGLLRGQKSLISQHRGAGDPARGLSFGAQAFYLAALLGLGTLLLSQAVPALFPRLPGTHDLSPEARSMAASYLEVRLQWSLPYLLALSLAEYYRATERTRLPMAADLLAHPLNILFNWALIFGHLGLPRLGVRGAALGTGLADSVSLALLLGLGAGLRHRTPAWAELRPHWKRLRRVFEVGFALGFQFFLEVTAFSLATVFIAELGDIALAAHNASIQILHFSFMPAVALGDAGSVLVGRSVGRRDWSAAERALRSVLQLTVPLMGGMGLVFLLAGAPLQRLFLHHADPGFEARAVTLGAGILAAGAVWQLADALQIAYRFGLRAAGDHRWVMRTGILCSWGLSVPLLYLAVHHWGMGPVEVWLLWSAELYLGALLFRRRWRSGVWREKRLVEEGPPPPQPPPPPVSAP